MYAVTTKQSVQSTLLERLSSLAKSLPHLEERGIGVLEELDEVGLEPLAGLGGGLQGIGHTAEAVVTSRRRVGRAVARVSPSVHCVLD